MSEKKETTREMLERRVEESRRRMRRSFARANSSDSWMKKKSDARDPGKKP